jgi:uncharacterized membrane protein
MASSGEAFHATARETARQARRRAAAFIRRSGLDDKDLKHYDAGKKVVNLEMGTVERRYVFKHVVGFSWRNFVASGVAVD